MTAVTDLIAAEERRRARDAVPDPVGEPRFVRGAGRDRVVLTNKYSEGYPDSGITRATPSSTTSRCWRRVAPRALFGVEHANVQPLSGAPANLAVYAAFLEPGDTVLGMALDAGGHLTHGWGVSVTGKWFRAVRYGVRRDTGTIDLDEVRELALRERPKLIWCGGTAIPRTIDFAGFARIAERRERCWRPTSRTSPG